MERSYKILPKAKLDLEGIFQYVSLELVNPESASQLIDKFEAKFKDICVFPKANPLLINANLDSDHLRKSMVDNFIIVYLYDESKEIIDIVRVIYAKRDYMKDIWSVAF